MPGSVENPWNTAAYFNPSKDNDYLELIGKQRLWPTETMNILIPNPTKARPILVDIDDVWMILHRLELKHSITEIKR